MEFDHFILGQGIAGTLLSWHLLQAGKTVLVIDKARPDSSSKVAAGGINPVTGKRYVAQNSEHLIEAYKTFEELSETLDSDIITAHDVIRFDDMFGRKLEDLGCSDLFSINYEEAKKWNEFFQYNSAPKKYLLRV